MDSHGSYGHMQPRHEGQSSGLVCGCPTWISCFLSGQSPLKLSTRPLTQHFAVFLQPLSTVVNLSSTLENQALLALLPLRTHNSSPSTIQLRDDIPSTSLSSILNFRHSQCLRYLQRHCTRIAGSPRRLRGRLGTLGRPSEMTKVMSPV